LLREPFSLPFLRIETKRRADADTLYSICSISKLFTAMGIMRLRGGQMAIGYSGLHHSVRQWGDKLVVIDIPANDLEDAIIKLEHDGDHKFTRLAIKNGDRRETWIFELNSEGKATRTLRHSGFLSRID
jgi:hypothetical protein